MSERFSAKKQDILNKLHRPNEDYTDASPKGSVDARIRELVEQINRGPAFVTTSSCSGRIAIFVEGAPKYKIKNANSNAFNAGQVASSGGKGGGRWLFTSHDPVALQDEPAEGSIFETLGFPCSSRESFPSTIERPQYIHFKFEPMEQAQLVLNAAMTAGFRESGISSLFDSKGRPGNPMVAVRSTGLGMDSIIGYQALLGDMFSMVSEAYLRTLIQVANERFKVNEQRMERFRQAFFDEQLRFSTDPKSERREAKRKAGLLQQEVRRGATDGTTQSHITDELYGFDLLAMHDGDPS